ncbi:uncharacterized protein LOC62_07G009445 [Vanrija pseudolonga]|uniref:Uncharacterized protein n=1 Tax=Vanrija pseudolonga TaxID=143232 RepID=A0AAF0YJT4_9TREE|nr:hypothetical protein LOC62_07G009445 [Vanrija pseudolonga]
MATNLHHHRDQHNMPDDGLHLLDFQDLHNGPGPLSYPPKYSTLSPQRSVRGDLRDTPPDAGDDSQASRDVLRSSRGTANIASNPSPLDPTVSGRHAPEPSEHGPPSPLDWEELGAVLGWHRPGTTCCVQDHAGIVHDVSRAIVVARATANTRSREAVRSASEWCEAARVAAAPRLHPTTAHYIQTHAEDLQRAQANHKQQVTRLLQVFCSGLEEIPLVYPFRCPHDTFAGLMGQLSAVEASFGAGLHDAAHTLSAALDQLHHSLINSIGPGEPVMPDVAAFAGNIVFDH